LKIDHVQVVYIHYGPHEKSAMHDHPAGVVVNLTNGHLKFTDQNGSVQDVRAIHGEARWFPPFKHQVENLSDTSYDGIYIGVKGNATAGMQRAPMDQATEGMVLALLLKKR
jgi:quercetin dioxygenase-like cupin family protein